MTKQPPAVLKGVIASLKNMLQQKRLVMTGSSIFGQTQFNLNPDNK